MKRLLGFIYGILCYVFFLGVFLRSIWFVWKMDTNPAQGTLTHSLLIDAALLAAFAVQHSGMARQGFKNAWTRFVPPLLERSTFVLMASLALLAVVEFWQPLPGLIWMVTNPLAVKILQVLFWASWLLLFSCTLLIDHFDLFGLKQAWKYLRNDRYETPRFRTPGPYRLVRHPLYLGFLIAFWSTPRMTSGHLFFAFMCTAYIIVGIQFEERDLIKFHGEAYRLYREGVSMLLPLPGKKVRAATESEHAIDSRP
ncbi:MAG TPA: isoprenylcysteine carboxylmethyltransferase family protein [Terriglobales bacterium]|nr:isoprenylcysteine carboxylmethyltransferase family protein [Terriglobales bacterium]